MFQHLFHGDPGTDFPEINERFFRHDDTPFNVLFLGDKAGESDFYSHANTK
jgi:hypothetical protein